MQSIVFLDTETTGLDPAKTHVVEIALKVVDAETGTVRGEYENVVALTAAEWARADPGALAVNGFAASEVEARGVPRAEIGADICGLFTRLNLTGKTAFFLCQNPAFDKAFFPQLCPQNVQDALRFPYCWLGLEAMNWALEARLVAEGERAPYRVPLSKDGIAASHRLAPEPKPHRAMNGVAHLLAIYRDIVGFLRRPSGERSGV